MNIQEFSETIGDLVGKDKLKEAISLLHQLLKDSPQLDEVILQSARFTDLMKQIRSGTISLEDSTITKNQIRIAILSLVEEIKENVLASPVLQKEMNNKTQTNHLTSIQQNHYGQGDNIGGDKIIIN